jgi:large subunit ribosomal protein L5
MDKLHIQFKKEIVPALKEELGKSTVAAVPRPLKVVVNMGTGRVHGDAAFMDIVTTELSKITGQKPSVRKARKSIAGFKLREGMPVGLATTLRGERMFDFINKLVKVALPRVRDFKGLSTKGFDKQGNYSVGIKEHTVFPEALFESSDKIFGFEVTIVTTAKDPKEAQVLLRALGFPFAETNQ